MNTTIVVTANGHNPTILHPSFLRSANIVSADANFVDESIICSPAVSRVALTNGNDFLVQPERLQISNSRVDWDNAARIDTYNYARRYLLTLPFVEYSAIGINFTAIVEQNADSQLTVESIFLNQRFLLLPELSVISARVGLTFGHPAGHIQVDIAPGGATVAALKKSVTGLVFTVNFHHDLDESSRLADASRYLESASGLASQAREIVTKIMDQS